ncbi:phosphatidylinositol N-acetylglucosaminyltransferase [Irpex rosettiformis]|uniref:Phosphatidylinositol N-acetylglucosaminyltransferase n=1 Tax=Irpex rosettiformis TaxID=378272 RepID=A0ACB8UL68_9APHY|nr:phosphatidylinositol N-acetylglucosaminyltransferase [Irpex rosettiformis]
MTKPSGEWDHEWERVLWKQKTYADNYVPTSFLATLSKNANFRPYTYGYLVSASCAITQHIAVIFIFLATFVRLKERMLDPRLLVWVSILSFVAGYSLWELLHWHRDKASRLTDCAKAAKSSVLVFLALLALSPILRTLTAATSSDSIWALSASLFILNVLLADYTSLSVNSYNHERLSSVLSMNGAISASVVLASRLIDDISVFALMLFSIQSFALFPMLRRRFQTLPTPLQLVLTALLLGLSIYFTLPLSSTIASLYATVFAFITFIAPAALVWAQRFKNEIRGRWDPAVPRVRVIEGHGKRTRRSDHTLRR